MVGEVLDLIIDVGFEDLDVGCDLVEPVVCVLDVPCDERLVLICLALDVNENFGHVLAGLVEMEIAEQRSRFEIDVGVPHLPNGDGSSFEVGLNSILIVLVIQSGSAANVRHRLKHGTLYSSIRQVLLEVAIDQRLEVDLLGEVWAQLNFVDGIGHAVESADNYILFAGHDVGPRVDVV